MQAGNILVIKLGALGDFIQSFGIMAAIRAHHRGARITLLTTPPFAALAEASGYFDHVWAPAKPGMLDPAGWLSLRRGLNAGGFSRVYDLQNNDRTAVYFRLFSPGKRPEWVGSLAAGSHFSAEAAAKTTHAFDRHARMIAAAGIENAAVDRLEWMVADTGKFGLAGSPARSPACPYVLLVPGSAPSRPEKRWPATAYGELAARLADHGMLPVIVGTRDDSGAADEIMRVAPGARNLTGATAIYDIAALARGAAAAVGNDTGPMHIIAATGCPSLTLFSRHSDPARHGPKGDKAIVLVCADLSQLSCGEVWEALSGFGLTEEGQSSEKQVAGEGSR